MPETFSSAYGEIPAADMEIIENNIGELRQESERNTLKRTAHLRETLLVLLRSIGHSRVREMVLSHFGNDEWYHLFSSKILNQIFSGSNPENLSDAVFFCKEAVRELWGNRPTNAAICALFTDLNLKKKSESAIAVSTVSCVQSQITDSIFATLFSSRTNVRVRHHESFRDACEDAAAAQSEVVLLPIENEKNGFINSFFALLECYELKIVGGVECGQSTEVVTGSINGEWNRFLLLSRSGAIKPFWSHTQPNDYLLDLILSFHGQMPAAFVFGAAELCSLRLRRADGIGGAFRGKHYVSFYTAERPFDTLSFLLFLFLFVPQFDILGIYPNFVKELR